MKFDVQGRPIISAPWDAINGMPETVSKLGLTSPPSVDSLLGWDFSSDDWTWTPYDVTPTWTGVHKFTASNPSLVLEAIFPMYQLTATSAAANEKHSRMYGFAGGFIIDFLNDASSATRNVLDVRRSGVAVTTMAYGNSADNPSHTFYGSLSLDTIGTTTSASIGGGTALPALPVGYITVTIAGTARKIPYYAT